MVDVIEEYRQSYSQNSPLPIMKTLTSFALCNTAPTIDYPHPDRLVSGNPKRSTWNHYEAQGVSSGLWECEPGAWRIAFADDRDEFFHVISGRIRITDAEGTTREFGPGDACVIPAGFTGLFEVIAHVRKHYVIIDRSVIQTTSNINTPS